MFRQLTIRLSNLYLDLVNPRYEEQKSQNEALNTIASEQKDKLLVLLRDIIDHGLNPSDLPIVMPDAQRSNGYIVLEGNRRIAALKLLRNPEILTNPSLKKRYVKLSESFKSKVSTNISCLVVESREEANLWIERKHEGEMNGAGTVRWDNLQKDRFLANKTGKTSKAVQLIDFMKVAASDDSLFLERLQKTSATNLDRFLSTPEVRSELGLEFDKGEYSSRYPAAEILKGLKAVIRILSDKDFTVSAIYHKEDRLRLLHTISVTEFPDKQARLATPWSLKAYQKGNNQTAGNPQQETSETQAAQLSTNNVSLPEVVNAPMRPTTRNLFFPEELTLTIHNERCNRIFGELKQMSHNSLPNACAVMMRVFIELSVDCYMETFSLLKDGVLSAAKDSRDLKQKANVVILHMTQTKRLDDAKAKGIRTAVNKDQSIFSIDTMNAYVHNGDFNPIPETLMLSWDNIEPFVIALWKAINDRNQ